jgi:hypothetical protein
MIRKYIKKARRKTESKVFKNIPEGKRSYGKPGKRWTILKMI